MISHVIGAWSVTWSVHDQSREQCMISHVISVWSPTWSVHDQPRDQCMISKWSVHDHHVISVWSATCSVHGQPRNQCIIRNVKSGPLPSPAEREGYSAGRAVLTSSVYSKSFLSSSPLLPQDQAHVGSKLNPSHGPSRGTVLDWRDLSFLQKGPKYDSGHEL